MKQNEIQPSQSALSFYQAAEQIVVDLASRWKDESEFEDIYDYKSALIDIASAHGVTIEKMCKRPFGCEFVTDGKRFRLGIRSTGDYFYKRIA